MRLTQQEIECIRSSATAVFGQDVKMTLFGSRADDQARGGDIDLMIESPDIEKMSFDNKIVFLADVKKKIGDRKMDVIYNQPETFDRPINRHARETGVSLL